MFWLNTFIDSGALWLRDHRRDEVFYLSALDTKYLTLFQYHAPRVQVNAELDDFTRPNDNDLQALCAHFDALNAPPPRPKRQAPTPPPPPPPPVVRVPYASEPGYYNNGVLYDREPADWAKYFFPRSSSIVVKRSKGRRGIKTGITPPSPADLTDFYYQPPVDPLQDLCRRQGANMLRKLLSSLTSKEDRVIRSHFGLTDGPEQTLKMISEEMNLSVERIRQIEYKALRKLRFRMSYRAHKQVTLGTFEVVQ
jgi:hypothetical protein